MTEDIRLSRARILIQQERYDEAEKVLKELLAQAPNNPLYLTILAELYLEQDKPIHAEQFLNTAVGIAPDVSYLFYLKSRVAMQKDDFDEAERQISHAITLDPQDAGAFALQAHIQLIRKRYQKALDIANQALALEADNLLALNTRSTALNKLDRSEESFQTIEGALREAPNNAFTHTNYGWGLLEQGNHKKALEHFKEALTKDPNFRYAQAGMLEALKASNPIYKLFLKYAFWMSNLTAKYQWGVIIGFYVLFRILRSIADNNEALQPFLFPVLIGLALIAFSTWVITPISNLFLRFNRYGQVLLDDKEKMSSNFVAISLGLFVIGLLVALLSGDIRFYAIAAFGFAMMVPCSVMFASSKQKNALIYYTIGMAIVGLFAIVQTFLTGALVSFMGAIFIFGFVAFQWIVNFLLIKESNV